ncbi:MAG: hypothetical protein ACOX8L_00665 [Candidatus Methanomethylophilaceae archaeon]|jgi:hypothetical protein
MNDYAITKCSCGRLRIVDFSSETSACPYCGKNVTNANVSVFYRNSDQSTVRAVLSEMTGFTDPGEDPEARKRIENADPISTLEYKYEHCQDMETKMEILASGLTEIFGTFTLEDMKKIERKNPEKILGAMLEQCIVFETETGKYRA